MLRVFPRKPLAVLLIAMIAWPWGSVLGGSDGARETQDDVEIETASITPSSEQGGPLTGLPNRGCRIGHSRLPERAGSLPQISAEGALEEDDAGSFTLDVALPPPTTRFPNRPTMTGLLRQPLSLPAKRGVLSQRLIC